VVSALAAVRHLLPSRVPTPSTRGILELDLGASENAHLFSTCESGRLHSLDCLLFAKGLPITPNHAHFLPTEARIVDRHAEERVFVLLVVGGKSVLVEQHQFRVIRARFRELGKLPSDGGDQAGLSCIRSSLVIVL